MKYLKKALSFILILSLLLGSPLLMESVKALTISSTYEQLFYTIDGDTVALKADTSKEATMLIFGTTSCGMTAFTLQKLSESSWIHSSKLRVIFMEIGQADAEEVRLFAGRYADEITFCYDPGTDCQSVMWRYIRDTDFMQDVATVNMPLTVLLDAEDTVHNIFMNFKMPDTFLEEINQFADISEENSGDNSQEKDEDAYVSRNLILDGKENYDYAYQVLELLNQTRASMELPSLNMDEGLLEAAMTRAAELSIYYSHTRPNGESCYSIYRPSEISEENIERFNAVPESVLPDWIKNEEYYENIVNPDFTSVGIGCFTDSLGSKYWVACFDNESADISVISGTKSVTRNISVQQRHLSFYTERAYVSCDSKETEIGMHIRKVNNNTNVFSEISVSNFNFTSSNTEIASVDEMGTITIKAVGTAVITAFFKENPSIKVSRTITRKEHSYSEEIIAPTYTSQGYTKYTCSGCGDTYSDNFMPMLTVPESPDIANPDDGTTEPGGDVTKPDDGTEKPDEEVSKPGNNTTKPAENVSKPNHTPTYPVQKSKVKKIKIVAPRKSAKAGKSIKLWALVKITGDGNANIKLKWSSSKKKYASVNQNGKVKTKKAGKGKSVVIIAKATDGSGVKAKIRIKIK